MAIKHFAELGNELLTFHAIERDGPPALRTPEQALSHYNVGLLPLLAVPADAVLDPTVRRTLDAPVRAYEYRVYFTPEPNRQEAYYSLHIPRVTYLTVPWRGLKFSVKANVIGPDDIEILSMHYNGADMLPLLDDDDTNREIMEYIDGKY